MEKIRTIYVSTPEFGVPTLKALINDPLFDVTLVITQPDKPVGRKQKLQAPPVKEAALAAGINVIQPEKISQAYDEIRMADPDLALTCAYGQMLPDKILYLPKFGCLNIHASLLPKYRGASPIQAAILNGDEETGISIMKMDSGLDTGPILAQTKLTIGQKDTAGNLSLKLSELAPKVFIPAFKKYMEGQAQPVKQDDRKASLVKPLKRSDARINWGQDSAWVNRFVRAMNPWPMSYTKLSYTKDKKKIEYNLKIHSVSPGYPDISVYKIGEIFEYQNYPAVQCGQGAVALLTVQAEGKNPISGQDFLRGHRDIIGKILH